MLSLRSFSIGGAIIVLGVLFYGGFVSGLSVFQIVQGGTGTSTAPTYGKLFVGNSAGTWDYVSTSSLGITGTSDGTFSTTSANHWSTFGLAFSTTSTDYWETQQAARGADGTFSTTSANYWATFGLGFSTTSAAAWLTTTDYTPNTRTLTIAGTSGQITSSAGAQDLSANRTWTLSLPSHVIFPSSFNATNGSTTNATSTTFFATHLNATNASSSALVVSGTRSAALITSATGVVSGASATTCTNQFVRSISAVMAGTCASISNADWSGTDLSVANGGTGLSTFGGSGTVLFTTAADTLSSDTDMTYDGTRNRLTLLHASTTAVGVTGALYLPTAHFNATRNGIGSTTPSSLWLNSLSSTTVLQQGQFVVGISSSTVLGTTQTVNWNTGNHQRFILNAATNFVLNSTSSNPLDGGKYTLELCQDGTGSRTATFVTGNTHIRWKNNATTTITSTANKCSLIYFIYEATYSMYRGVGSTTNISIN